jgi:hypothetical protein
MMYELWDVASGNRIGSFGTESEALVAASELLEVNDADLLDDLALGAVFTKGEAGVIDLPPVLHGEALMTRIHASIRERAATSLDASPTASRG